MAYAYPPTPLPHHLHVEHERVSAVPLKGIRQIPDEADRWWKNGNREIPNALQRQCDEAIQEAMAEHGRRRLAIKRDSNYGRDSRFQLEEEEIDTEDDVD